MIRYKKDIDNIVTLTLDMGDRNVNIINHQVGKALLPILAHLREEKRKRQLKGVIITSAKKNFVVGGDLDYLQKVESADEVFELTESLKKIYRELEQPGVPVVAAINGTALGSGFELALACHHRIVIDHPKIRLGLPEVNLGLMPGSGGVIRLLWLLGIERAYPILTSGRRYATKEALELGIIDALAKDQNSMLEQARSWVKAHEGKRRPWDREGGQISGGNAREPNVAKVAQYLAAQLAKKSYQNLPAPQAILNTLVDGSLVDFDTASRIESRNFTALTRNQVCRNMTKAFWYDFNTIKAGESRPKGFGKFRPRKVGIVGAGKMGSAIAFVCLMRGMEVVLKDISRSVAARGKEFVELRMAALVKEGRLTLQQKEKFLNGLTTTEKANHFETCDLVIEAVFENENLKAKVIRESEVHMDEYAFLASNTLSFPITRLAKSSIRSDNFVGLHFFAPAEEVPLVEIVRGKQTSDETIARAFDFVKAIHKIPILVKDNWGFYVARVQNTYILEGISLLQEGYAPALIENLGLQAGMPKGALSLADELSLPIVLRYELQAAEHYGTKYIQHPAAQLLGEMMETYHRLGKQKKAGFYDYKQGERPQFWQALGTHFPSTQATYDRKEIIERLLFVQVIEAVWCLQEGIVKTIAEANLGSIHGWGFPAFKGGALQFVEDYGLERFIQQCKAYEQTHGPRFKVPKFLTKRLKLVADQS
ncbi:MAG: 3-hydroxyacyl-CoA dehydrogenase NAD-binding domain-containing protein [Bacteroidota bacterium]